jgi:hypothetical protein
MFEPLDYNYLLSVIFFAMGIHPFLSVVLLEALKKNVNCFLKFIDFKINGFLICIYNSFFEILTNDLDIIVTLYYLFFTF